MKSKKLISMAMAIAMALSIIQVSVLAEQNPVYVGDDAVIINPCEYIAETEWENRETFISIANDLTTAQEYIVSIPIEVAADGEYQLEIESASKLDTAALSPIKLKIDDGDNINLDENAAVKSDAGKATGWGVNISWKRYNEKISLSSGIHTLSFIVDEMRIFRGKPKGYYAALGTIKLLPPGADGTKVRADKENILTPNDYIGNGGWIAADGYVKVESGDTEAKVYTLEIPIILPEAAIFSMSAETCLNPSDGGYHFSRIKFSLDGGDFITINDTNSPVVGETEKSSWGASLELRRYNEYMILGKGAHKLTFVVDELRMVNGEAAGQFAALGDITLSPLFAAEKVGGSVSLGFGNGWTYSSNDSDIASVSTDGDVSIKRSGKAIVEAVDAAGNTYKVAVYGTRNAGIYVEDAYISGNSVYFDVKNVGEGLSYRVVAGKRKKSTDGTIYGFNETVTTSDNYADFTSIEDDEEIVIFAVDDDSNHLYGKTVIAAE